MAQAKINITPFSGSETDNFNEFEQLITGAIGVATIAAAQQANFLQLHLKGDALRYFLTLPEASRLDFADSITYPADCRKIAAVDSNKHDWD